MILTEKLSNFSTYKIGGVAKISTPSSLNNLKKILKTAKALQNKIYIIGIGSNILFPENISNNSIFISLKDLKQISLKKNKIYLSAGVPASILPIIGILTNTKNLFFTHLLPGTIGGGIFMNARCYNNEFCNILDEIFYLDENLKVRSIKQKDCSFSYKSSIFQHHKWVIIGATFNIDGKLNFFDQLKLKKFLKLQKNFSDLKVFYEVFRIESIKRFFKLKDIPEEMIKIENDRINKHHFDYPSCGSVFKNNYDFGSPTGKLIDELGLKGFSNGGAKVSEYHGNFIINVNNATQGDIIFLIEFIQKKVKEKYGFTLETEVRIIHE